MNVLPPPITMPIAASGAAMVLPSLVVTMQALSDCERLPLVRRPFWSGVGSPPRTARIAGDGTP